jgi:type VI protein secretion system component VasK
LQSEDWVLGPQSISGEERARLGAAVKTRYLADYSAIWLAFVQGTSVVAFNGPADASNKLGRLADADSPLLGALSLVSRNTQPLGEEFQPLHAVQPPPEEEEILIGQTNQGYVDALRGLQGALDQVATATGGGQQQALQNASGLVLQGEQTVGGLAQAFARQPEGALATGAAVRRVLEDPIRRAEALVRTVPLAQVNGQGQSFCRSFTSLLTGYPFDPRAAGNADIENVIAALKPGQSALSSFIQDDLQGLIVRQGNRYVARSGADPAPSAAFLAFVNRAFEASEALFDAQGQGPRVDFRLIPENSAQLPEVTVVIDGISQRFTRTSRGGGGFSWNGATARDARIEGRIGDEVVTLLEVPEGPWALFRLFELAEWEDRGGTQFGLRWNTSPGLVLQAELYLTGSTPIFQRGFLDSLSCVSRVVR